MSNNPLRRDYQPQDAEKERRSGSVMAVALVLGAPGLALGIWPLVAVAAVLAVISVTVHALR